MSQTGLKLDETDDEFFGTLESRSNLADLFDRGQELDDSNQSLKYKPPKQVQNTVDSGKAWTVRAAKVVTALKLINQQYISQGRVGLAILNNSQNDYRIILYRTRSNVLSTKTLQPGNKLIFKSSYLQFHDDSQDFWSVFLETNDEKSIIDHLPPDLIESVDEVTEKAETTKKSLPAKKSEPTKHAEPSTFQPDPEQKPETEPASDDSNPSIKAKLLSRMAKMGKPLPKLATPQTTTDVSDSSDTEVINISPKPSIIPRKVTKSLVSVGNSIPTSSLVTYATPILETQYMNMLLTENRTQNTEIRMNLSKLETKIEKVLDKIELLGSDDAQKSNRMDKDDEILRLEEKILELRKESRSLRQNVRELEAKKVTHEKREKRWRMDDDDEEFEDVLSRLGIQLKDCNDLDHDSMELLEKAVFKMSKVNADSKRNEQKLAESNKEIIYLNEKIANLQNELKDFQDLKLKVESFANKNKDLIEQLEVGKTNSRYSLQATIKEIMNNLYEDIARKIESADETPSKDTILRICGNAMRKETMNAFKGNTD